MPRIGSPQTARPVYFDRNPVPQSHAFGGDSLAPHANTTRATFTVPANKKAFVESSFAETHRVTAAGTGGDAFTAIRRNPAAVQGDVIVFARIRGEQNAINDLTRVNVGVTLFMEATDTLTIETFDGSTTGTVDFFGSNAFTEFDA